MEKLVRLELIYDEIDDVPVPVGSFQFDLESSALVIPDSVDRKYMTEQIRCGRARLLAVIPPGEFIKE